VKRIRMSIQKATGQSPWKHRAAIVALCVCAVSLHAQSTEKEQALPKQSEAAQKLQERVTQLESEVTELKTLVKQMQSSSPVRTGDSSGAVVAESVQSTTTPGQAYALPKTEETWIF